MRALACAALLALGTAGEPAAAQPSELSGNAPILFVRDAQGNRPSIVVYDPKVARDNARSKRPIVEMTLQLGSAAALNSATRRWDYHAAIDDRLGEIFKGTSAKLASTHTEPRQGRRSYLFVTAEPAKVAAALGHIALPSDVTASIRTLAASELEAWRPTPLELEDAQDEEVRRSLAKHGDDGTKPRMVDFFFYGGDQVALRAAAKQQGFETRAVDGGRPGSVLSRRTAVDTRTLTSLNRQFHSWSSRFRATYDGWEAEVLKK